MLVAMIMAAFSRAVLLFAVICILLCEPLSSQSQYDVTKTIHLKPSTIATASTSGITIATGISTKAISDKWNIDVKTQQGSDIHLSLDPQWGFHPEYISSITFTIDGNTSLSSFQDDGDILFVFNVANRHFSEIVSIDQRRSAFKQCPISNTQLIMRDVTEMIDALQPQRYYRFCQNAVNVQSSTDHWINHTPQYKSPGEWPMILSITNNPVLNTTSYSWTDDIATNPAKVSSQYITSFATNSGLDLFISGDNLNENFFIFSINVTYQYTLPPTPKPTSNPTIPTINPTKHPSVPPTTAIPSTNPTPAPTKLPTSTPTQVPSVNPTPAPSLNPTLSPSYNPTTTPSFNPSVRPTLQPTNATRYPTDDPSANPSKQPTFNPSEQPTLEPTTATRNPSNNPTNIPTNNPSVSPTTAQPSTNPTFNPSRSPTMKPTNVPTSSPTDLPSRRPTTNPTHSPSNNPTITPSTNPTATPSSDPSPAPTLNPSPKPSDAPIIPGSPTVSPTSFTLTPTNMPSIHPTLSPSTNPSIIPTFYPSVTPTHNPSDEPSVTPSSNPSVTPSNEPSFRPSNEPSVTPSNKPTVAPSDEPSFRPSNQPSFRPSSTPSYKTTVFLSDEPTPTPSSVPSISPIVSPKIIFDTMQPTERPTPDPTTQPANSPTTDPSAKPTSDPSVKPTQQPVKTPSTSSTSDTELSTRSTDDKDVRVLYTDISEEAVAITMPAVVLIFMGSASLCVVLMVSLRNLCKPPEMNSKINMNTRSVAEDASDSEALQTQSQHKHEMYTVHLNAGALSDTDSVDGYNIKHIYHVHPRPGTAKLSLSDRVTMNRNRFHVFRRNTLDSDKQSTESMINKEDETFTFDADASSNIIKTTSDSSVHTISESLDSKMVPLNDRDNMAKFIQLVANKKRYFITDDDIDDDVLL